MTYEKRRFGEAFQSPCRPPVDEAIKNHYRFLRPLGQEYCNNDDAIALNADDWRSGRVGSG
jgi:hypothetical protein